MLRNYRNAAAAALAAVLIVGTAMWVQADEPGDAGPVDVPAAEAREAQPPPARPRGLEAITVTARRIEEDLQTTPVSVSAFTADDLTGNSVMEVKDLGAMTPNMRFENVPGTGSTATITVRGISQADLLITGDPSVGVYIDGVYNARIIGANFHLLDTDRVEVLKGPQGTLYGRNTPAGAVNIWSRKPDGTFGGWAKLTAGEDSRLDAQGAIQFPIFGETLSARIAFQSQYREGYIDNKGDQVDQSTFGIFPTTNTDEVKDDRNKGIRGTLRYVPSETHEIVTRGYYFRKRGKMANPHMPSHVDPTVPDDPNWGSAVVTPNAFDTNVWDALARATDSETTFLNNNGREDVDYKGGNFEWTWDYADNHSVKLNVGHRDYIMRRHTDSDGTPFKIFHNGEPWDPVREKSRQHSDDLTFSGLLLGEKLQYTAGAYYFQERSSTESGSYFGSVDFLPVGLGSEFVTSSNLVSKIRAWALYGQGSYQLTDQLSMTLGIRTTYERREARRLFGTCVQIPPFFVNTCPAPLAEQFDRNDRWNAVTWTAGLEYRFTDNIFTYAKASKGYRSGGFNGRATTDLTTQKPFDEEKVTTYEIGAKSEFWDNRIRTNLALFLTRYKDLQTTSLVPCASGICTVITNSGNTEQRGVELEINTRLIEGLDLNGTLGVTDFEYRTGKRSGGVQVFDPDFGPEPTSEAEPANSPAVQFTLTGQYTLPEYQWGILSARLNYAWQSENYSSSDNGRVTFPFNLSTRTRMGAYGVLNGRIALTMPRYNTEVAFFMRNMLDREYWAGGVDWAGAAGFGQWTRNWAPRRKWGVEVSYYFGSESL